MSRTFKALQKAEKDRGDVESAPPIKIDPTPDVRTESLGLNLPSSLVVERAVEFDRELKKRLQGDSISFLVGAFEDVECAARRVVDCGAVWVSELARKVLIIDACFSTPILHRICGIHLSGGLSDVGLNEEAKIHQIKIVGTNRFLHLMTTGTSGNPATDPERMDRLGEWINKTGADYDRVIVFGGGINSFKTIESIGGWIDGVVFVLPLNVAPGKVKRVVSRAESSGSSIIGLIALET